VPNFAPGEEQSIDEAASTGRTMAFASASARLAGAWYPANPTGSIVASFNNSFASGWSLSASAAPSARQAKRRQ
jgi:hypothetical protein